MRLDGWAENSKTWDPDLVPEDEGDRPPERFFEGLSVEGVQLDFLALKMLLVRCLLGERHRS